MTIGRCEIENRRLLPLVAVHVLAMFFPFAIHFLSGGGIGFFHLWPFFVVVESAFLFYSADFIDGDLVDRYLLNLLIHFSLCLTVGGILSATTLGEYTFHDGSCIPMGGPWWLVFIMVQGLDYGILAIPLVLFWAGLRCLLEFFGQSRGSKPGPRKSHKALSTE